MISFSGVYVKLAHVTPEMAGFYRVFIGGMVLMALAAWKNRFAWNGAKVLGLGIFCGLLFSLDLYAWHSSIHYIGPGLATILTNFQVFFLALIGIVFLGERITPYLVISVPMAILGLALIIGFDWNQLETIYRTGVYLGLAAAVFYTGFILSLRRLQSFQTGRSTIFNLLIISFAASAFLGMDAIRTNASFHIPDVQSGLALFCYGTLSQVIGWILISHSLPQLRASFAGLILMLQPTLAFVWDVLFFARATTTVNWIGVFMTISAIYLGSLKKER